MTVQMIEGRLLLGPVCPVDDAEGLLEQLLTHPEAPVDLSGCTHLHTAVAQVLLAARPGIEGEPASDFLKRWIAPLLRPKGGAAATPPTMSDDAEDTPR